MNVVAAISCRHLRLQGGYFAHAGCWAAAFAANRTHKLPYTVFRTATVSLQAPVDEQMLVSAEWSHSALPSTSLQCQAGEPSSRNRFVPIRRAACVPQTSSLLLNRFSSELRLRLRATPLLDSSHKIGLLYAVLARDAIVCHKLA